MTQVFHVYFRVLRRHGRSTLLAAVLRGLERHAHLVNIDFVDDLMGQSFQIKNPNRARSLIFSYCNNAGAFHRADAAGYAFWADRVIEIDGFNPQVAARLTRVMDRWKKLPEPYRAAARTALERVAAKTDLSNDVREVITRALAD